MKSERVAAKDICRRQGMKVFAVICKSPDETSHNITIIPHEYHTPTTDLIKNA